MQARGLLIPPQTRLRPALHRTILLLLGLLLALVLSACSHHPAPGRAGQGAACVLVDNDYDIDDMMAIPAVLAHRRVAALVQTEGYTLPQHSAPAVHELVNRVPDEPHRRSTPIIVGADQGRTDLEPWPWLPFFRTSMNHSNALLDRPPRPWAANPQFAQQVVQAVSDCPQVSILVLGPFTSFVQYMPLIRDKVDRVVVMGRPLGDVSRESTRESFNCGFDLAACREAMQLLQSVKGQFVDIPRERHTGGPCANTLTPAPICYSPQLDMVTGGSGSAGLRTSGLPGRLRQALTGSLDCGDRFTPGMPRMPGAAQARCSALSTWVPDHVAAGPGGESLMWDQAAALFLLFPDQFELYFPPGRPDIGGRHFEPVLINGSHAQTAQRLRDLWTATTNATSLREPGHRSTPSP